MLERIEKLQVLTVGLIVVLGILIGTKTLITAFSGNTISVTGSAYEIIKSDKGSVSFNFEHIGLFIYKKSVADFDTMFETALEGGARDVEEEDENYMITCEIPEFANLSKALEKFGEPEKAEIIWQPKLMVEIDAETAEKIERFTDALEDNDDVQKVYTNADFE